MKIFYFAYNRQAPSFRYRGEYLLQELSEKYGTSSTVFYPPTKLQSLPLLFLLLKLYIRKNTEDIFIFQKICNHDRYFQVLAKIMSRVSHSVYDLDDAMHEIKQTDVVDYFIQHASWVVTASESLRQYSLQTNPHCFLLTTPLPKPALTKTKRGENFTVGWIGVYRNVHVENLDDLLFPALLKIPFPFTFKICGIVDDENESKVRNIFRNAPHITLDIVRNINWNDENEINHHIQSFDVGTDPMFDNSINQSKSAFKIKQYLACGVPVLASNVGENGRFLIQGETGFLCEDSEWVQKITFFKNIDDAEYQRFSKNCRMRFEESDYNLTKAAVHFHSFLQKLVGEQ